MNFFTGMLSHSHTTIIPVRWTLYVHVYWSRSSLTMEKLAALQCFSVWCCTLLWLAQCNRQPYPIHVYLVSPHRNKSHGKNNRSNFGRTNERAGTIHNFDHYLQLYFARERRFFLLCFALRLYSSVFFYGTRIFFICRNVCGVLFSFISRRIGFTTWHLYNFWFIFMSWFVSFRTRWDFVLNLTWSFRWKCDTFAIFAIQHYVGAFSCHSIFIHPFQVPSSVFALWVLFPFSVCLFDAIVIILEDNWR